MKGASTFSFGDKTLVGVHVLRHRMGKMLETPVFDKRPAEPQKEKKTFVFWFPVKGCNINRSGILNEAILVTLYFIPLI